MAGSGNWIGLGSRPLGDIAVRIQDETPQNLELAERPRGVDKDHTLKTHLAPVDLPFAYEFSLPADIRCGRHCAGLIAAGPAVGMSGCQDAKMQRPSGKSRTALARAGETEVLRR